jgi:Mg/Co/Ni transporter MgtE
MDSKVSDAVLNREAVNELTKSNNPASRILSATDESKAKELLKAFHQRGITLMPDVMQQQAEALGWESRYAKKLAELATQVGNGGRVVIKQSLGWGERTAADILAKFGL